MRTDERGTSPAGRSDKVRCSAPTAALNRWFVGASPENPRWRPFRFPNRVLSKGREKSRTCRDPQLLHSWRRSDIQRRVFSRTLLAHHHTEPMDRLGGLLRPPLPFHLGLYGLSQSREDQSEAVMFFIPRRTAKMPTPEEALPGRSERMPVLERHFVLGTPLDGDFPGAEMALFGMGCFWGPERMFWQLPGVISTAVGYAAGYTPNPTYDEVCSGRTGHNEVVRIVFDPSRLRYEALLKIFSEGRSEERRVGRGGRRWRR